MATKKVYDLAVVVGKYTKDGNEKNRYQNIGIMLEKDDGGRFIVIEPWFNPSGIQHENGKGIMISMFPSRQQDNGQAASGQSSAVHDDHFEDDIPF